MRRSRALAVVEILVTTGAGLLTYLAQHNTAAVLAGGGPSGLPQQSCRTHAVGRGGKAASRRLSTRQRF